MWKRATTILFLVSAALTATMLLGGCYYMQAVNGQLELMRKREPIPEVLANSTLPDDVRDKLELVMEARQFSVEALGLPDNGSYRSYADLERDFVVWNVFAAPEFSLEPETWCFPVVGCVAYRGYFSEDDARRLAEKLAASGYDVYVGGVPAYSTLGRFDDPVLNTMMRWSDVDLISTVFHELAHQRLFVKGDTAFNESFATAVAEAGLERWLAERDETDTLKRYYQRDQFRRELRVLADAAREDLAALYASGVDEHAINPDVFLWPVPRARNRRSECCLETADRRRITAVAQNWTAFMRRLSDWPRSMPSTGRLSLRVTPRCIRNKGFFKGTAAATALPTVHVDRQSGQTRSGCCRSTPPGMAVS